MKILPRMHSIVLILALAALIPQVICLKPDHPESSSDNDVPSLVEAVLFLTGATDESELSEAEMETFRSLAVRPLNINISGRAALQGCGLFSAYQVETILDWRARTGPILSVAELAAVDGFNPTLARVLSIFLDFAPLGGLGPESVRTDSLGRRYLSDVLSFDAMAGTAVKVGIPGAGDKPAALDFKWNAKAMLRWHGKGGDWQLSAATRQSLSLPASARESLSLPAVFSAATPEWAFSAACSSTSPENCQAPGRTRFRLSDIIIGNFNARFGQGLVQWSGLLFSDQSTPSAMMLRPSGVRAYTSYSQSNSMFGAAARMDVGSFSISPWINFGDPMKLPSAHLRQGSAGLNATWYHRNGQVGVNSAVAFDDPRNTAVSLDFQHTLQSLVLFGEAALDVTGRFKGLAGGRFCAGPVDVALRLKYDSAYEHNLSASASYESPDRRHVVSFSPSMTYYQYAKGHTPAGAAQLKARLTYTAQPSSAWKTVLRLNYNDRFLSAYADPSASYASSWSTRRFDIRQDVRWEDGKFMAAIRGDVVLGDALREFVSEAGRSSCCPVAMLAFVETAYKHPLPKTALYLQSGLFCIDKWNDRVWLYCRDAPSIFNVSQMYGRGWWSCVYASVRACRYVSVYARAECTAYPWARAGDTRKDSSFFFRIQLQSSF